MTMAVKETGVSYYGLSYVEHAQRDFQDLARTQRDNYKCRMSADRAFKLRASDGITERPSSKIDFVTSDVKQLDPLSLQVGVRVRQNLVDHDFERLSSESQSRECVVVR